MIQQKPRLVVALPTKDEEENIADMAQALNLTGLPYFVVDGNSTDKTLALCAELGIEVFQRDEYGWGYGCGIRKALDIAAQRGYDYLAFIDCDNSYPVEALAKFAHMLPAYDLIVGARPMDKITVLRRLGNISHSWFATLIFAKKIMDVNSGLRIISVKKYHGHINAFHNGMVAQITCLALRNNFRFIELPITYRERKGRSKTKVADVFDIFLQIVAERVRPKINAV